MPLAFTSVFASIYSRERRLLGPHWFILTFDLYAGIHIMLLSWFFIFLCNNSALICC